MVHLVRRKNGIAPFHSFLKSYKENPAGVDHDLLVVYKGFSLNNEINLYEELLRDVPHSFLKVSDIGLDLQSYFIAAEKCSNKYCCFLNSFSIILEKDWLLKLYQNISQPGVGLVGATGSWESISQWNHIARYSFYKNLVRWIARKWRKHSFDLFPNYHIRTNGFMIMRDIMLRIHRGAILTKSQSYRLESGKHSITKQIELMGFKPIVVGRNGKGYEKHEWDISNTFRRGMQKNLLFSDNQTRSFDVSYQEEKQKLELSTWGKV